MSSYFKSFCEGWYRCIFLCLWHVYNMLAHACPNICMEIRGQYWMLILTFYLLMWDRISVVRCSTHQNNGARNLWGFNTFFCPSHQRNTENRAVWYFGWFYMALGDLTPESHMSSTLATEPLPPPKVKSQCKQQMQPTQDYAWLLPA